MKKALILSYFYPPSNFVANDRLSFWAENLSSHDIFPIVITRQWNENQTDRSEEIVNNNYTQERTAHCDVHRLPYHPSLSERLLKSNFKLVQRLALMTEQIASLYFKRALSYNNFYPKACELIENDPDIQSLIISGSPFQSFILGYKLKKRYPHIHWLADYRDEWSTMEWKKQGSIIHRFINKIAARRERTFLSNATGFFATSEQQKQRISAHVERPGTVIQNGFSMDKVLQSKDTEVVSEKLTIIYGGTLYADQPIEFFMDNLKSLIQSGVTNIEVKFIGISALDDTQNNRIKQLSQGIESHVCILPRIPRTELDEHIDKADLLLITKFNTISGFFPVKMFTNFQSGKTMLLCPTDNEVMHTFIADTNCGYIVNDTADCQTLLAKLCAHKAAQQPIQLPFNYEAAKVYSREFQTKKLADYLHTLN